MYFRRNQQIMIRCKCQLRTFRLQIIFLFFFLADIIHLSFRVYLEATAMKAEVSQDTRLRFSFSTCAFFFTKFQQSLPTFKLRLLLQEEQWLPFVFPPMSSLSIHRSAKVSRAVAFLPSFLIIKSR